MERAQLHTKEFLKSSDVEGRECTKTNEVEVFYPSPERVSIVGHRSFQEEVEILQSEIAYDKEIDFSDENFHPENHPKFPRWRKIVLKVGVGVTTFGVLAILTPIPLGWLITPIGVGIMTIAVGKKHAGRHLKSILVKTKEWIARNGKKLFGRKNRQETVENKQ